MLGVKSGDGTEAVTSGRSNVTGCVSSIKHGEDMLLFGVCESAHGGYGAGERLEIMLPTHNQHGHMIWFIMINKIM